MGFPDRRVPDQEAAGISRSAVPGCRGRIPAHAAWAVVGPAARALDPQARLTLITSGLDMDHTGCSGTWDFVFYLPGRNATVMLSLEPASESGDMDSAPLVLTRRIRSAFPHDAGRPPFPDRFRDSPDVVIEFTARGVDFVAGPTDMKLEGRILPSGDAVWVTYFRDREFTTPFTPAGT